MSTIDLCLKSEKVKNVSVYLNPHAFFHTENVRTFVFIGLGAVSVVGVLLFLVLIPVRGIARLSGEDVDAVAINTE